jgi:DNA repair exonuclease SbcCD ATPase subunit
MKTEIVRSQTPEEKELRRKLSELAKLQAELAQRELDLATLQAELHVFEGIYLRTVGVRLAKLDEINAQIAEAEARLKPKDKKIQEQAAKSRAQARKSAEAAEFTQELRVEKFQPSEGLKKLYREVAKAIHPDLAVGEEDRILRQKLMADANRAYEEGDEAKLRAILVEWESSPESVKGEGTAVELVRVIRKIAQVEQRIHTIEIEITQLKESDVYELKTKVEKAEKKGRNLLGEMASQVDEKIILANKRLAAITRKEGHT